MSSCDAKLLQSQCQREAEWDVVNDQGVIVASRCQQHINEYRYTNYVILTVDINRPPVVN